MKKNGKEATEVEWFVSKTPQDYQTSLLQMQQRVELIQQAKAFEQVWLLEHPSLYTKGTSAHDNELISRDLLPVYETGRGGKITYHGPGQRMGYVMLDLNQREKDVRAFVWALEEWLIKTLEVFSVQAERRSGRIGLWVKKNTNQEEKIAALGIRVEKWVTFHGFALNVFPDLSYYKGIIPCGIQEYGVTSLQKLGITVGLQEVDEALKENFSKVF